MFCTKHINPSNDSRNSEGPRIEYPKRSRDLQNCQGFCAEYTELCDDLRSLWKFRISCRKPFIRLHNYWGFRIEYTELSSISYLICRTLCNFVWNIRKCRVFCMEHTKPYVFSETFLDSVQYWWNIHVVLSKEHKAFLNLRNSNTLSRKTTKLFWFNETENSSLEKHGTLKVR